jgi:nucleoid-associated protein YgaU
MRPRRFPLSLLVLLVLPFAGCGRAGLPLGAETGDRDYVRGQELKSQERETEALAAFLRVIESRGSAGAPESHLEAGLLSEQRLRDPIAAIYHYRKYLELAPTSPQAPFVRDHIDAALRDFARTLPGQPLDSQSAELLATVEALKKENAQLRAQPGQPARVAVTPAAQSRGSVTPPVGPAPPPPNQSPATRRHAVAAGDTLSKIARQYYGDSNKWRQIYEANRDVMKDENRLPSIGTELKIP